MTSFPETLLESVNEIEEGLKTRLKEQGRDYTKEQFQRSPEFNDLFESINLETTAAIPP